MSSGMPLRKITDWMVVHCSATKPSKDIGVAEIRQWHLDKGWADIGYHYVIRRSGIIEVGRPERFVGSHAKGRNSNSIGICLVGGLDEHGLAAPDYTPQELYGLKALMQDLQARYRGARPCGHRDVPGTHKDCPCFDVEHWWISGEIRL